MEILSHGNEVKVIEPQSLVDGIKQVYQDALGQY
jgi:predicted DNA-binding transcriptional regulator YafY